MRSVLVAIFIAIFATPAQAEICAPPKEMRSILYASAHNLVLYGLTHNGYELSVWEGPNGFVMLAEDDTIACLLASGNTLYVQEGWGI